MTISPKPQTSVSMVSLGCPKNLVDSEIMLGLLKSGNYKISGQVPGSDVVIINTCAFIEGSRQESMQHILQLAELKRQGKVKGLVVTGCLPQKYHDQLGDQIEEIDAMVGTGEYMRIDEIIQNVLQGKKSVQVEDVQFVYDHSAPRFSLTPPYFKYVKVGEGCDHRCSFCIIPQLRGDYRSRTIASITEEVKRFVDQGMKEVNLISQDTSYYGRDLDGKYHLAELLEELNRIEGLRWIRLLYNHPIHMTDEILNAMAGLDKVCKYVDIPLQHISDNMLKNMKRGMLGQQTRELMDRMREKIPGLAIRTTFIVGYPGETENDFTELHEFIKEFKFERLGVFAYSRGDDKAAEFEDQVSEKIKKQRRHELMASQQEIMFAYNAAKKNQKAEVLFEEYDAEQKVFRGRTYADAPEIDTQVLVGGDVSAVRAGDLRTVKITGYKDYDLTGELV